MKGGITLAIYIAIGITGAAFGQSSIQVKTVRVPATDVPPVAAPPGFPSMTSKAFAPIPSPSGWKVMTQPDRQSVALTPPATPLPPVTIADDQGGNISQYHQQWWRVAAIGNPVELRGGC